MFASGSVLVISMGQAARPTLGLRALRATRPWVTPDARARRRSYRARSGSRALWAVRRQSEELRRLSTCRNGLPSEGREIVLLAYHYGLTREQIARRVNRPVATVKGSLRRSLKQLKECLGQ